MAQKPRIPKGTRDFSPQEVAKRNYIFDIIKQNFECFGFQPIETPSFELSETLMGKYGEEGDRLIFKILESGDYLIKTEENDIESSISIYLVISYIFKDIFNYISKELDKSHFDFSTKLELDNFSKNNTLISFTEYKVDEWSSFLIEDIQLIEELRALLRNDSSTLISLVSNFIWSKGLDIKSRNRKPDLVNWQIKWAERHIIKKFSKETVEKLIYNQNGYYKRVRNSIVHDLSEQISGKALKYDLTVPFARYVVQHQNDIVFPFKRYQIQPVWRADRPQKGRFREFYQCDADVVGSKSLVQEVEFVQLYDTVFTDLGLKGATIKLNNRKILSGIAEVIGAQDKLIDFTVALDKLDKIGEEKVKEEMLNRGIPQSGIDKLSPLFSISGSFSDQINSLKDILSTSEEGIQGIEEIEFVYDTISTIGLKSANLELDVTLARGLNYYTGAIFEVAPPEGVKMGSIGGGGRYDDLTGIFGLKDVSGVGISFGLDRIYLVLEELGLFPETVSNTVQTLFINFGAVEALYCLKTIKELREAGVSAELYPDTAKMKKQMNYANRREIPFVVLVGSDEVASNTYTLKHMKTGEQSKLTLNQLIDTLK